jgi:hypothetical protein
LNLRSVSNISSTGLYVQTEERLPLGEVVSLTLHRYGLPEDSLERPIVVEAKVARWGNDGMGLTFLLPAGMDLRLWESEIEAQDRLTEPEAILREFRLAAAISFLCRLCPQGAEEIRQLLREGLGNRRDASAVEIASKAEGLLASRSDAGTLLAPPQLLVRILEDGSWSEEDWVRQLWAKLLVAALTVDGQDNSGLAYVDLLSQLSPVQFRILASVCTRSTKFTSGPAVTLSRPYVCKAEDLVAITNKQNLLSIDRDLAYLAERGLIVKSVRTSSLMANEKVDVTPTDLGLKLYSRCTANRARG